MDTYIQEAHVAVGNIHQPLEKKLQGIECMGVYWPSLRKDVYKYGRGCSCELGANSIVVNAITLYHLSAIAPRWAKTLVKYLITRVIPKKMSKERPRYLEKYTK